MRKTRKARRLVSADSIARLAERGKDISAFFTNTGRMMPPIQRVNVDFTTPMLQELDKTAGELNISRQALIKTFLRQALDQHYLAQTGRNTGRGSRSAVRRQNGGELEPQVQARTLHLKRKLNLKHQ